MRYLNESARLGRIELSLIRQVMQSAPPDAINLALGELGFTLPDLLRSKALELLQQATPRYTPNAGIPGLRQAISDHYHGSSAEQVCVCNGVEEALFVTLQAILDPGDLVAVPDPDYPAYSAICKLMDASVMRLPFESDILSVNWDEWDRLLTPQVKALVFSHPSNPCGHVFSAEELERLVCLCEERGIILIVDEIYKHLWFDHAPPGFFGKAEGIFILGGLSKSHCMSGWRIGWVLSPLVLAASVIKARQYVSTCSNWLSQHLAEYALSPDGMQAADEVMEQLKACRSLAREKLSPFHQQALFPSASPYMMLKVNGDDLSICRDLAAKGVICVPGIAFGEVTKGWLRLNYAVPQEILAPALDTVIYELYLH